MNQARQLRTATFVMLLFILSILGVPKKVILHAKVTGYYDTSITQTINGVTWTASGIVSFDDKKQETFIRVKSVSVKNPENLTGTITIPDYLSYDGNIKAYITLLDDGIFKNSSISGVILNKYLTSISASAFEDCKNLKTVTLGESIKEIGDSAFYNCTALEAVAATTDLTVSVEGNAFFSCSALKTFSPAVNKAGSFSFSCSGLTNVNFKGTDLFIGTSAFHSAPLEKITFDKNLTSITIRYCGLYNTNVKELIFPCKVTLACKSVAGSKNLRKLECIGPLVQEGPLYGAPMGIFEDSFYEEYENGKLVEKEAIFHSDVSFETFKNSNPSAKVGAFLNCSGLTKISFLGEKNFLPSYSFEGCKNLHTIIFNSQETILGNQLFFSCAKLNTLTMTGTIRQEDDTDRPFLNSNITNLTFSKGKVSKPRVSVAITHPIETLTYDVTNIYGSIEYSAYTLKNLIFKDPNSNICIQNNTVQLHNIIGYSSIDASKRLTESWMLSQSTKKAIFTNIISPTSLQVKNELELYGTVNKKDIDFSNLGVTASYSTDPLSSFSVPMSLTNNDTTGYIVDTRAIPEVLTPGKYSYTITYSGISYKSELVVKEKQVSKISVEWNSDAITNLVANQPVTAGAIITGGIAYYNDGSSQPITANDLILENTKTILGENLFKISYKENPSVFVAEKFTIAPNKIVAISAQYQKDKELFVGDTIDISKIIVTAIYKYPDDTLEKNIKFTKISEKQLTKVGENRITVYVNDISCELILHATDVIPTKVYASFDSKNFQFINGQREIDKKSIIMNVEFNNGTRKIANELTDDFTIEEKLHTGNTILAVVHYKNITSDTFLIPVTEKKITGISVTPSIASAIEGTKLDKNCISKIEISYNNGITEELSSSTIQEDNILFNPYTILANQENTIQVTYLGFTSTFTIWGIPNELVSISGEYIGSGVPVGQDVPKNALQIYALHADGTLSTLTNGILLEHETIYNVGENKVTIHYGSFSCEIIVPGIPNLAAPSETPVATPAITLPPTSNPNATTTPTPTTSPDNNTDIKEPDIPNVPAVSNGSIKENTCKVFSNISSIKLSNTATYKVITNKTLVLKFSAIENTQIKYQIVKKGEKKKKTWNIVKNNTIKITKTSKPCIVYIQYKNTSGKQIEMHTNGFMIDKLLPTTNIQSGKSYKIGKKVVFKDNAGIKKATLNRKKIKSGTKLKKAGKYTLVLTDLAGNKKTIKFNIKK